MWRKKNNTVKETFIIYTKINAYVCVYIYNTDHQKFEQ